jgi:uncharacterized protein YdeI (YjbR/CyaY-like superfamily)
MAARGELPTRKFATRKEWAGWLAKNHDRALGVWIALAKASSGVRSVTYAEALEEALCHGWIDGQKRALDGSWWLQKFTPRGPRSIWSRINTEKAEALIASGSMRAAGLAAVEAAKRDGRWKRAYASPSKAAVPPDLQRAFQENPDAGTFFATLNSANRYAILWRIETAKRPETRARRIAQLTAMLARHEKLHP